LSTRLGVDGAVCTLSGPFNCDSLSDVFGSSPEQLEDYSSSEPSWWEESLYGPYDDAKALTNQYYFSGDIAHCDSPRLGLVPIVWTPKKNHDPLNWDIGDAPESWPNGKKEMKIIGFYTVYIREPNTPGEVGSGPIEADIIYLGPGSTCGGAPINFNQTGVQIQSVLLVQP
jgi:hypothetical protein